MKSLGTDYRASVDVTHEGFGTSMVDHSSSADRSDDENGDDDALVHCNELWEQCFEIYGEFRDKNYRKSDDFPQSLSYLSCVLYATKGSKYRRCGDAG